MHRSAAAAVAALLVIGYINGASMTSAAPDPTKPTVVLAALGDSITTAAGSCGPYPRCLNHSWATGTKVNSVYQRLQAANPEVNVKPLNLAQPGAGSAYLYVEAMAAVARKADYITILIGANDA
jgi:lysophospholipase L1-like esterase